MASKAQLGLDIIFVLIFLVALMVIGIVTAVIISNFEEEFTADEELSNQSKQVYQEMDANFSTTWDNSFLVAAILLWVLVIVTSFFVDTHPIFFIITVLLVVMILAGVVVMSNFYEDFKADPEFSGASDNFPFINFFFNHSLEYFILLAVSAMIALYGKSRTG